jgi:ubiquinone/menaquinone biosynthesis C-methylase UbiE
MRKDEQRAAELYDLQTKVYGQGSIDQMNAEIPGFIKIIKDNKLFQGEIVDVGVGTGQLTLALLKALKGKVLISGFDISDLNVKKFKQLSKIDKRIIAAETASFYEIPFKDNSFDLAISNHVLHYAEDLHAALKEIRSKIKTGGYFIFSSVVCEKGDSQNIIHGVLVHDRIPKPIHVWAYQRSKEDVLSALNSSGFFVLPTDKGSFFKEFWPAYYFYRSERKNISGSTPHTFLVTAQAIDDTCRQTWDTKFPENEFKLQLERLMNLLEGFGYTVKSQSKFLMPLFYKTVPNARGMFNDHTLVMSTGTTYEDRFYFFLNGFAHILQWKAEKERKIKSYNLQKTLRETKDIKAQYEHKLDSLGYLLSFMREYGFERYTLWYFNYFMVDQKYLRDYALEVKDDINFEYFQSLLKIGEFLEIPESKETTVVPKLLSKLEVSGSSEKDFIYFV